RQAAPSTPARLCGSSRPHAMPLQATSLSSLPPCGSRAGRSPAAWSAQIRAHLDMTRRAPVTDLVAGARLAGLSESTPAEAASHDGILVHQLATFGTGSVRFDDSGNTCPTSARDGWIVIDYGSFQRAYTGLTRDARSGVEKWLSADWNGAPTSAAQTMMVQ